MLAAGADVIALQEVTARTAPLWRASLAGYVCLDAVDGLPPKPTRRRLAATRYR